MVTKALPRIVLSEREEAVLFALALDAARKDPSNLVARILIAELQRAEILPDDEMPETVVRMHSLVEFEADGTEKQKAKLVFPGEADSTNGRLSILSPIGAALIGLSPDQSMRWHGRDGPHGLRVIAVEAPPDV
jgi:regulator of nucleoside diphosphate kinase